MPDSRYRIEILIPPEWSIELEKMQKEVYALSGRRVSKSSLILQMMEKYFDASSSCNSNKKKT